MGWAGHRYSRCDMRPTMDATATVLVRALSGLVVVGCLTAFLVWLIRTGASTEGTYSPMPERPDTPGRPEVGSGTEEEWSAPVPSCLWLPETAWSVDPESDSEMRRRAYARWECLRDEVETVRRTIGV